MASEILASQRESWRSSSHCAAMKNFGALLFGCPNGRSSRELTSSPTSSACIPSRSANCSVSSRAGRRRADSRSAFSSIVIVANFASEHFWAQPGRDNPSSREFEPPGLERPRPARRICDRNCEAFGWTIKSFVGSRQPAWRNRTRATVPTAGSNKEPKGANKDAFVNRFVVR